jgi:hypothetical protein
LSRNTLFNATLYANYNNPFIGTLSKRDYTTDQFQKRTILIVDRRSVVGNFHTEICATSLQYPHGGTEWKPKQVCFTTVGVTSEISKWWPH